MNFRTLLLILALPLPAGACAKTIAQNVPLLQSQAPSPVTDYRVQRGDQLEVRHLIDPEYTAVVTVRPDGKFNVPGVKEDISAEGRTISEIYTQIRIDYILEGKFKQPNFGVQLHGIAPQKAFVGGEVQKPGGIDLQANSKNYVVQVLMSAGWLLPTAQTNEIVVIRNKGESKPEIMSVNLDNILTGKDLSQNIVVLPMDQIYVPRSGIAIADTWVDQYIRQIIPLNTTGTVGYIYNPASTVK
jgi:protein involved in polysaccharide export with SLBB domain